MKNPAKKSKKRRAPRPTAKSDAEKLQHARDMVATWELRRRRLNTWVTKWTTRVRYYERKVAKAEQAAAIARAERTVRKSRAIEL